MPIQALANRAVPRQFAIGIGIAVFLPLAIWQGVTLFHTQPDAINYHKTLMDAEMRASQAQNDEQRAEAAKAKAQIQEEYDETQRLFLRTMFWVTFPIGLLAVIVGVFCCAEPVGAGLMFGGLFAMGAGYYSYSDKMGAGMRFGSLMVAFVIVAGLGHWRFRKAKLDQYAMT